MNDERVERLLADAPPAEVIEAWAENIAHLSDLCGQRGSPQTDDMAAWLKRVAALVGGDPERGAE